MSETEDSSSSRSKDNSESQSESDSDSDSSVSEECYTTKNPHEITYSSVDLWGEKWTIDLEMPNILFWDETRITLSSEELYKHLFTQATFS